MRASDFIISKQHAIFRFENAFLQILLCVFYFIIFLQPTTAAASELAKKFQSALDTLQKKYHFPGATAAYVLHDGTVVVAATGHADLESKTPMLAQSRMLAASIGKTFVGATAAALAHEGVLNLDTPISRWLGKRHWFSRLPNHDAITLRQLLNHTSGLPDHVHLPRFASEFSHRWREKDNPFSPEDLIRFILDQPALFEAGKGWAYTDTGYILIGLVIEEVTQKSYYDVISKRFLTPLGLTLTSPAVQRNLPGLAAGYTSTKNAFGLPVKTIDSHGKMVWHPGIEWTGGGLVSNSRDLARWGSALFSGQAMASTYLDELLKSVPISRDMPDIQYGAGVAIYRKGRFGPVYGHGGWIPGYNSSLRYYPNYGITIAFQLNTDIGITDEKTNVIGEMEALLADIVISATHSLKDKR